MSWIKNRPLSIVLKAQLLLVLIVVIVFSFFPNFHNTLSAMLGGMVGLISSAAFAVIVSQHKGYTADEAIKTIVRAELLKISVIVIMLWLVFKSYENVNALVMIGTFILTVLAHSMVLFVSDNASTKNKKIR